MTPDTEAQLSQRLQAAETDAVRQFLGAETSATRLAALAENAATFAEDMTKKHLHPASPPVACKSGCAWCCYQLVPVSVPEVARIASFIRESLPPLTAAAIVGRLETLDRATRGLTPQQRVGIPKPCAFLEDNQCTIHPVRPLACAEFTSYDVQVCKSGKRIGFKPGAVMHEKARLLAYSSIQRGLEEGLKRELPDNDCESLELIAAVAIALKDQDAIQSWLKGVNAFKSARLHRGAK